MKRKFNPLPSQQDLLTWFSYDPHTGELTRRVGRGGRSKAGQTVGYKHHSGRIYLEIDHKHYARSRIAIMMMEGVDPAPLVVDHINRDNSDDRYDNLRVVTESENVFNRPLPSSKYGAYIRLIPRYDGKPRYYYIQ